MQKLSDDCRCLLDVHLQKRDHLFAKIALNHVQITHRQRQALRISDGLHGKVPPVQFLLLYLVSDILQVYASLDHLILLLYQKYVIHHCVLEPTVRENQAFLFYLQFGVLSTHHRVDLIVVFGLHKSSCSLDNHLVGANYFPVSV